MEAWRKKLNEEKVHMIYENLIEEFVNEINSLKEEKAEINEILSSVKGFANKAYNTYKTIKSGAIKAVLDKAIDSALKLLDAFESKIPKIAGKLKTVLNKLKKSENMTIAVSIVSIIVGLMTGEAIDALGDVLNIIGSSSNTVMAFEAIQKLGDSIKIGQVVSKTGQLTKAVSGK